MSNTNGDASRRAAPEANARGVLHQRRNMPFRPVTMAACGFLIVAAIGYFTLYHKSRPGTSASDVAKATAGDNRGASHQ
ncbi:hypothetical protein MUK42_32227 [Musa troglodytarum]|uniref:Transmembrane protein n=1 Tax=Musa troglodytarum TaxID=320322 RepID=A0A9E7FKM4_9LILI|nr:hypothetical protein MUK42_32227 [Musa troglodytarum]